MRDSSPIITEAVGPLLHSGGSYTIMRLIVSARRVQIWREVIASDSDAGEEKDKAFANRKRRQLLRAGVLDIRESGQWMKLVDLAAAFCGVETPGLSTVAVMNAFYSPERAEWPRSAAAQAA